MKKQDIKNILMSLRNQENDAIINNLLGEIDIIDEEKLQVIGNDEESVRNFFENKISEKLRSQSEEKFTINDMFTYGIAENCIHLHLSEDLRQMSEEKGIFRTIDTMNLYLLDAIDRIKRLRDDGFYRFQGKDSIYMKSPILVEREMKFLESMNFTTQIGAASISFKTIASEEWQDKKEKMVQELGISLKEDLLAEQINSI